MHSGKFYISSARLLHIHWFSVDAEDLKSMGEHLLWILLI